MGWAKRVVYALRSGVTWQDGAPFTADDLVFSYQLNNDAGLPFVNHAFNATTLTLTAHMHVMSTSPTCFLAMQGHPDYFADDYVVEPLLYRGGKMAISERPGLGVEIDPDKLARFAQAFESDGMAISYAASRGGRILAVPNQ